MKNKCKFVGIMFLCILIVCTLAVMAYEHTAGMKGAAGGASNASGNTKNTDEADDMLTVVTSFYPMYIATLNIVDGVEGVRLENLSEPQTGCLHDFQLSDVAYAKGAYEKEMEQAALLAEAKIHI